MFIKNSKGKRILSAKLDGKLYILETTCHGQHKANVSEAIWHQRLNHASYGRMRKIKNWSKTFTMTKNKENDQPCFGCSKGKLRRRRRKTFRKHPAT